MVHGLEKIKSMNEAAAAKYASEQLGISVFVDVLAGLLAIQFENLSHEKRIDVVKWLMKPYCRNCGTDTYCECENDE